MKLLITGAAGKLGSVVCSHLVEQGYRVRATDRRHRAELPVPLEVADLCDDTQAYRLLEGCEALVHLGNHPNLGAASSPQRVLSENTAMNVNVFRAALDLGIRRIVFASSVQAMLPMPDGMRIASPLSIPYLPLDGRAPTNPSVNLYGFSKEVAERLLERYAAALPDLRATALRFPWLVNPAQLERACNAGRPAPRSHFNFGELLAYLPLSDAASLVQAVLERQAPGYHQYYPAQTFDVRGVSLAALVQDHYPGVPLRLPVAELRTLVDISDLEHDLSWQPGPRQAVEFSD